MTVDANNSPYVLPPGSYGVVTVTSGRRLDLLPEGAYVFCSLRLRADAVLGVHGSNRIYVSGYVSTGVRASIVGEGACSALWIARGDRLSPAPQSAAFDFGGGGPQNRSLIQGRFFTPAKIAMAQHNDYVGDFWAGELSAPAADRITRTLSACRASYCGDGTLDPGESCDDGNNLDGDCCSAFCTVRDPGSACDDGLFCTGRDYCDSSGQCRGSGDPCPGPDGDGDCSESCNEASDSCTMADASGSPCDDGDMCTAGGSCHAGLCRGEEPLDCSDGDLCTYDYCDPGSGRCNNYYAPDPHCRFAGSSFTRLAIGFADQGRAKASSFMSRRRLAKGLEATSYGELGDPTQGDEYALCVYDSFRQDPELVYRLDLSAQSIGDLSAWRRRETRSKLVYRLKLPEGSSQGVSKAKLALDKDYALSLSIKAGANPGCGPACRAKFKAPLPSSSERIFAMDPSVVFQWTASTGACWSSEYLSAKANDDSESRASTR